MDKFDLIQHNKIPKASEFYHKTDKEGNPMSFNEKMIEFAKLHLEAQAKAICEKVLITESTYKGNSEHGDPFMVDDYTTISINQDSILNAYPLSNIE